jgi:hypothetical protein
MHSSTGPERSPSTIGDPTNPSTTVIMTQPQTVTANFVVCQPGVDRATQLTVVIRDGGHRQHRRDLHGH